MDFPFQIGNQLMKLIRFLLIQDKAWMTTVANKTSVVSMAMRKLASKAETNCQSGERRNGIMVNKYAI